MHENSIPTTIIKKRRSPLTQEQWAQHVKAWKAGDLSKTDYSEQHHIDPTGLIKWAKVLGVSRDKKFKAVSVSVSGASIQTASTAGVEILVGQFIRVRLTGVSDPSLVVGIIKGVHACS